MTTKTYLPKGAGPCAKQVVTATLTTTDGDEYVSTNFCLTPQSTCPRGDMPSGTGYHLCKEICNQPGHAEENAIFIAKKSGAEVRGSTVIVEGIHWICGNCKNVCRDEGVADVRLKDGEVGKT